MDKRADKPTPAASTAKGSASVPPRLQAYWRRNLSLTLTLLAIWFVVGYLLAIVFAPQLNRVTFLGGPLGFWIAQNGAIYVFVLLILTYAVRMNRMDDEFDVAE